MQQLKTSAVPSDKLICSEYCFYHCMNPFQHPGLDQNIHKLIALLRALSNTCGGVVYLSSPKPKLVTTRQYSLFKRRLCSLPEIGETLLETSQSRQTTYWAIIVAKKSRDPLWYNFDNKCVELWVDIHGQLQQEKFSEENEGQQVLGDTGGGTLVPVPKEITDVDDNPSLNISDTSTGATNNDLKTAVQSPPDFSTFYELNWDQNKKNWQETLKNVKQSPDEVIDSCDIWHPCLPMRITPSRESMKHLFMSDGECMDTMQKLETRTPGFGIANRSWAFFLPQLGIKQPPNHLCDILTVAKGEGAKPIHSNIVLWVVVSSSAAQITQRQVEYMFIVGRAIKHQLSRQARGAPTLAIRCMLHSTHEEDNTRIENTLHEMGIQNMQDFLCSVIRDPFNAIQRCIALLLLSQQSPIKICAENQLSVKLSAQQAQTLLDIKSRKVSYISSPPGTGKTLCGLSLHRDFGKDRSVYISPTEPLLHYLRYNGCKATLVRNDKELSRQMKCGTFDNKACVIIDESHRLKCSKAALRELFILMNKHGMRLFVFADNAYQSFDRENQQQIQTYIHELSREVWGRPPYEPILTEIFRNTRKVVSFLQHAMGTPDSKKEDVLDITCCNAQEGDGIQCIAMENPLEKSSYNALVQYLRPLLYTRYQVTDVAVLLDSDYTGADINTIHWILQSHLPRVTTHSAATFPRRGIIVDRVERFSGLDAALCIILLSVGADANQDANIANPRFRVYLASRATHKAVFVVRKIDAEVVQRMKFDNFQVSFMT